MTAQQIADLTDRSVPKRVAWILQVDLDGGSIYASDQAVGLTYNSQAYEPQLGKWRIPSEISTGQALVPQQMDIAFDGADQFNSGSLFERILTGDWYQRSLRLSCLIFNGNTGAFIVAPHVIDAVMDFLSIPEATDQSVDAIITCETGTFRVNDRRHTICADRDQRLRSGSDTFFKNTAIKNSEAVPFGIKNENIPGRSSSAGSPYDPGFNFNFGNWGR
jgi:hypothetical protein